MSDAAKTNINTRMPKGAKRPKTSRACLACRKLKARCEPAGGSKTPATDDLQSSNPTFHICHRCKTLCIDCLYESPSGQVVKGEDLQPDTSTPSPAAEHNRPPRSSKRSRSDDVNAAALDPSSNDRAVFLSPSISPSALTRSIYRDIDICSLNTPLPTNLERPVLPATAFSRLIGTAPTLKPDAQQFILGLSGAFGQGETAYQDWKQAPPNLCLGKTAALLLSGQSAPPPYPHDQVDYLTRELQSFEHSLRILFQGLYGPFSPFLSIPFEDSLTLATCQGEAQCFLLLSIYLVALPHLDSKLPIGAAKKPLRKAVDALLRRAIHRPHIDHLNIFALHSCASFLLLPVDGFVDNHRPLSTPEQENDGLLEFALDLNPRAAIISALIVAQRLGYASLAAKLPSIRLSFEADSPPNSYASDSARDEYAHAVLCTFTWLTLLQFRASVDVAEDRIEWDSLAQFEHELSRVRIDALTASLLPPPPFLSPREQSRCCWMAQRAELYGIARDLRHTRRAAASFSKKEAEEQATGYKKALDEWRYKFNEQMRSMSTEFRKDPRGLGLHRYYSIFSNAEAQSLQVCIGSVYHKEFAADMRQRLQDPFYLDHLPWKSAATILLGHESDRITKAILINFAFTDAMLKALGLISSLTPVMPQLYDFVSYEETVGSEIPSLCIVAPPNIQAGLFAVPVLAAADLRLSVIEAWGASASYFNPHLLPLLTNCVKSLRACHVNVDMPGVLKLPFITANPIADYLQGPFEILMRKVAAAEERLQISHVESILSNAFLLSSKKKEINNLAEELAPDAPEMVQAIADSQKVQDEISASMMGSLHVQAIQEIEDTEFAVKVFGSDMREGDVRPIRKSDRSMTGSAATTPDADGLRKVAGAGRSDSIESEQTGSPSNQATSSMQPTPMHRSVRTLANTSQLSSPGSSTQSASPLHPEPPIVSKDAAKGLHAYDTQGLELTYSSATYPASSMTAPPQHPLPPPASSAYPDAIQPAMQSGLAYPATYPDGGARLQVALSDSTRHQLHDSQPANSDYLPHSVATATYGSSLASDPRYQAGDVVGASVNEAGSTCRINAPVDAYIYRPASEVPQMHAANGAYDPPERRLSGVKTEDAGFDSHYPQEPIVTAGTANIPNSEVWSLPRPSAVQLQFQHDHPQQQQQQQQHSQQYDGPYPAPNGIRPQIKYEACPDASVQRHADVSSAQGHAQGGSYYMTQQHPQRYGSHADLQYQMGYPNAADSGHHQTQHHQMHPPGHHGIDGQYASHQQPQQPHQTEGQPPTSAIWEAWSWTPAQQQQQQYAQHAQYHRGG
ncbi:uncharacterized protein UMAG_00181 [Mycosarcoma maydis]|uniref:Zn(2)-C6 fungal-type domain-containing protein n=1 Tax=Mycosarcoma maydis TaxID=5270 RepID=A0A0D1E8G2_MYCMD|nr:uncharacterized protein UMAG_00181 [Ustilago maydis 521]KIS71746.1 hypothetical protein UMAG_00181 [Ustilago maydis 521]|eukprot:XP_011386123.1 hypothetical protein UMAG_00181 [Ustilago maydis 521]